MTKPPVFPKGWRVHPCVANGKEPLLDAWQTKATDDPKQIEAWFVQFPHANWAVAMGASGLAVLDIDGQEGEDSLTLFEVEHGELPKTREHRTQSGGRHLIFIDREHRLGISAGKIATKLDTRGSANDKDSYILIAPSKIGSNSYSVLEDRPLAPVPDFLVEAVGQKREAVAAPENIALDDQANIARAIEYAKRAKPAVESQGGDNGTYIIAAEVLNLGLSQDAAFDVLAEHYNPRCIPPWDDDQLRTKIENACAYMQNSAGAFAIPPMNTWLKSETVERLKAQQGAASETEAKDEARSANKFFQGRADFKDRPEPKWVLEKIIREDTDACIVGPSQHLKSEMMAHLGGDWRRNEKFLGDIPICIPKGKRGPVFYAAPEDPNFLGEVRVTAWEIKYGDGEFTCNGFNILDGIPLLDDVPSQDRFIAEAIARTPSGLRPILMFDTLIQSLNGSPEDSSDTMTRYCQMVKRIRWKTNAYCTITAHHMGWEGKRSRGSSALYQGMDTMIYLTDRVQSADAFIVKMTMDKVKQGRAGAVRYPRSVPLMTSKGEGFSLSFTSQPPAQPKSKRNDAEGIFEGWYGKMCRCLLATGMVRPKACDSDKLWENLADQEREIDDSMTPQQIKAGKERVRGAVRRAAKKDNRIDALGFKDGSNRLRWGLTKEQASLISDPEEGQCGPGSGEDLT